MTILHMLMQGVFESKFSYLISREVVLLKNIETLVFYEGFERLSGHEEFQFYLCALGDGDRMARFAK